MSLSQKKPVYILIILNLKRLCRHTVRAHVTFKRSETKPGKVRSSRAERSVHFCCYVTERFSEPAAAADRRRERSVNLCGAHHICVRIHVYTHTNTCICVYVRVYSSSTRMSWNQA